MNINDQYEDARTGIYPDIAYDRHIIVSRHNHTT